MSYLGNERWKLCNELKFTNIYAYVNLSIIADRDNQFVLLCLSLLNIKH